MGKADLKLIAKILQLTPQLIAIANSKISIIAIDRNCDVLPIVEYSIETDDGQTLN